MAYKAVWHEESLKDLKKFDRKIAKKIVEKVKIHLTQEPIKLGAPLKGNLKGFYRYRISEYRIIYALDRAEKKVIILNVKHRKEYINKEMTPLPSTD